MNWTIRIWNILHFVDLTNLCGRVNYFRLSNNPEILDIGYKGRQKN